jgi:hypothetical protein
MIYVELNHFTDCLLKSKSKSKSKSMESPAVQGGC